MAKLSSKKHSQTHRVIVYGASFTGKSLLVGKLAEHFNLIWVDMEAGHGVLYQLPEEWQDRIEIIELPDTRSYPIAIESVLKLVKGAVDICEAHGKCGCMVCKRANADTIHVDVASIEADTILVFDTLTQLSNSAMANVCKKQPDDYKVEWDDYSKQGVLLDIVLSHIQQAPYNVVVISHENEVQLEGKGKKTSLTPVGGTRNFSRNITKYFTDVVYLERKNKKHTCISTTTSSTSAIAGSQTGVNLETMGEPSLLPIFKPEVCTDLSPKLKEKASKPAVTVGKQTSSILGRLNKLKKT